MKNDAPTMPCHYIAIAGSGAPLCSGPGTFTAHDKRGCVPVCGAHAQWLQAHSWIAGHSDGCEGWPCR